MRPFIAAIVFSWLVIFPAQAEKITVVYTAQAEGALYACGKCPANVGGGLSRRAALIRRLTAGNPNALLLEGCGFSAPLVDKAAAAQTQVYCRALAAMGYTAVALGGQEEAYGGDFWRQAAGQVGLKLLCSGFGPAWDGITRSTVKNIGGLRVGIAALAATAAGDASSPQLVLAAILKDLENKTDLVVLISELPDVTNQELLKKFPMVKVVLSCSAAAQEPVTKCNGALLVRAKPGAKELMVVDLDVQKAKIVSHRLRLEKLPLDAAEDPQVKSILPACFQEYNCPRKTGMAVRCDNPGGRDSACVYVEVRPSKAVVITDKECRFCSFDAPIEALSRMFPGLTFDVLDYRDGQAGQLLKKFQANTIPLFIFDSQLARDPSFGALAGFLQERSGSLIAKPVLSGICLLLDRPLISGRMDFFLDLNDLEARALFDSARSFCRENGFIFETHLVLPDSRDKRPQNLDEEKIALGVKQSYPDKYLDYLSARLAQGASLFWIDALKGLGIDWEKIKPVAAGAQIKTALDTERSFNTDLGVFDGGVILVNNRYIFKVFVLDKEHLRELMQKK